MTDKEQIIIKGVDVSKCFFSRYDENEKIYICDLMDFDEHYFNCDKNPNCYFKQLARKTQEYNELALQIRETQEYSDTCAECKDDIFTNVRTSYSQIEVETRALAKIISSLKSKTQECESLKEEIEILKNNFDTATRDCNELIEELRQECEELKKANQHIDANRQCKGSKLKRIEDLISACETGYTDEFIQKIYGIIQESEPTVNDYSIIDRYRKALEEIEAVTKINCEEICGRKFTDCNDTSCFSVEILDIISGFADGQSKASPDSEQIEHTAAKPQMRNSVSVEQIQDNKAKGEGND